MNGETWVALATGVLGFIVGVIGLVVAMKANGRADAANRIANEANGIAERALQSSEQLGREQLELLRREVEMSYDAKREERSANLRVSPGMRTSGGEFRLRVENRGPRHADDIALSLHHSGETLTVGQQASLPPGTSTEFVGRRGGFLAGALETEPDDLSHPEGQIVELRVAYVDGNGPQLVRKRLTISPGSRFVNRKWTIDDWPTDE